MVHPSKHRRRVRFEASKKQHKKPNNVSEIDEYWKEISAKCVDAESIRVQEELLRGAVALLQNVSIEDTSSVHTALDSVHLLAKTVAMLKG